MRYKEEYLPDEVEDELLVICDDCLKHPLRPSVIIDWNGPLLYPECVPDSTTTNNALRQPILNLLSEVSPRYSTPGAWELELRTPLAVGEYTERCAQVWSCDFRGGSEQKEGRVVVKFYFRGWFSHTNFVKGKPDGNYMNEKGVAMTEARAFKPIQGSQVPFCYGIYEFILPGGFTVEGMVLEDLSPNMRSVQDLYESMKWDRNNKRVYEKWIDRLLIGMCTTLHAIHKCNVRPGMRRIFPPDIFILRKLPMAGVNRQQVVFVGFGFSLDLDAWEEVDERLIARRWDCGTMIQDLHRTLDDGIAFRWQEYMHSGGHTVLNDPDILFEDPSDISYYPPHHDGEFDDVQDN